MLVCSITYQQDGINVSQIAKQEEAGKKSLTKENRLYHKNINY